MSIDPEAIDKLRAAVARYVVAMTDLVPVAERINSNIAAAGQAMADEAEQYLRDQEDKK